MVQDASCFQEYLTHFDILATAEALFIDWDASSGGKGDIYVVTKGACGLGRVGRIPASYHQNLPINNIATSSEVPAGAFVYPMMAVLTSPPKQGDYVDCANEAFRAWQGADMRRDGRLIALITGQSPPRVYFYPRVAGATVAAALSSTQADVAASCPYIASTSYGLDDERKHEAVAFLPDGKSFADTSECSGGSSCKVPIYFWNLIAPNSPSPISPQDGTWSQITFDDFESGDHLGNYKNGTRAFPSQAYACPLSLNDGNSWSIEIFEHNGAESAIAHKTSHDASQFAWLRVTFDFLLDGFDHMDTLFLELSLDGGYTFFIVYDWAMDTQGVTELQRCYMGNSVVLGASSFELTKFTSQVRLRFRTSANAKNDRVYIDNVLFEGRP